MKKRNPEAKCENCPYWEYVLDEQDCDTADTGFCRGYCHRFPPKFVTFISEEKAKRDKYPIDDLAITSRQDLGLPFTSEHDYCGEHPDFLIDA